MTKLLRVIFLLTMIGLTACSSVEVSAYKAQKPTLDLRQYFNGMIEGHGMFQNRSGEVIKRFRVVIDARWDGATGTLDEAFTWSDGATSRRVWTISDLGNGHYTGTADDVVGEALGEAAGNALRWRYVMALPVDGKVYDVDFDDWMFLIDDKTMLNRSVMKKFGFHLGEVTLSFQKP